MISVKKKFKGFMLMNSSCSTLSASLQMELLMSSPKSSSGSPSIFLQLFKPISRSDFVRIMIADPLTCIFSSRSIESHLSLSNYRIIFILQIFLIITSSLAQILFQLIDENIGQVDQNIKNWASLARSFICLEIKLLN